MQIGITRLIVDACIESMNRPGCCAIVHNACPRTDVLLFSPFFPFLLHTKLPCLPRRSLSAPSSPSSSFAPEKLEIFNLNREQMDFSLTNYYQPVRIPAFELFRGVFGPHRREEIIVQDFNDFDRFIWIILIQINSPSRDVCFFRA